MTQLLVLSIVATLSLGANAAPFADTYFENKNWSVIRVGTSSAQHTCAIRSAVDYFDKADRNGGGVFLEVSHPSKNVTLLGVDIAMYFKISKSATIQVAKDRAINIVPEEPFKGDHIVSKLLDMKAGDIKVLVSFGDDNPSIHKFAVAGFSEAYKNLKNCSTAK